MEDLDFDVEQAYHSFSGEARWLEIGVRPALSLQLAQNIQTYPIVSAEPEPQPLAYTILSPRQKIMPVPYALYSLSGSTGPGSMVGGSGTDNYIPRWLGTSNLENSVIYQTDAGNVGIGTTVPGGKLEVKSSNNANYIFTDSSTSGYTTNFKMDNTGLKIGHSSPFRDIELQTYSTTRMTIDSSGNVGIGTTSPTATLQVTGTTLVSSGGIETIFGTAGKPGYRFMGLGVNMGMFAAAANELAFSTNSAERIRINSAGNVGIGTTAPRSILEVKSEAGNPCGTFTTFPTPGSDLRWGTQGIGLNLVRKSTGTWEAAGDGASNAGAAIFGSMGSTGLLFVTADSTGSGIQTFTDSQILGKVRMVIGSSGKVGVGTLDPTEKLDVDGTARLRGISAGSGTTVVADGTGKLFKQSSSIRYKTNIQNLENEADKVLELRPVRFQFKTTGQDDIGLIAEEVEAVDKDLVVYDQEGKPDAVKYDKVSLYLLGVVKELKSENESLKQRLETLEKKIENIEQHDYSIVKDVQQ